MGHGKFKAYYLSFGSRAPPHRSTVAKGLAIPCVVPKSCTWACSSHTQSSFKTVVFSCILSTDSVVASTRVSASATSAAATLNMTVQISIYWEFISHIGLCYWTFALSSTRSSTARPRLRSHGSLFGMWVETWLREGSSYSINTFWVKKKKKKT